MGLIYQEVFLSIVSFNSPIRSGYWFKDCLLTNFSLGFCFHFFHFFQHFNFSSFDFSCINLVVFNDYTTFLVLMCVIKILFSVWTFWFTIN